MGNRALDNVYLMQATAQVMASTKPKERYRDAGKAANAEVVLPHVRSPPTFPSGFVRLSPGVRETGKGGLPLSDSLAAAVAAVVVGRACALSARLCRRRRRRREKEEKGSSRRLPPAVASRAPPEDGTVVARVPYVS